MAERSPLAVWKEENDAQKCEFGLAFQLLTCPSSKSSPTPRALFPFPRLARGLSLGVCKRAKTQNTVKAKVGIVLFPCLLKYGLEEGETLGLGPFGSRPRFSTCM
jgi:hypothetical protein